MAYRVGSLFGVPIRIHYTWFFIIILIAWTIAVGFLPTLYPEFGFTLRWMLGVLMAILLFVSVLIHELAHSLVARSRNLPVRGITLFIFGGVSEIPREADDPTTSFLMSIAGPMSSIILGLLFTGLWLSLTGRIPDAAIAVFQYLGTVNLILALFNLIPAFPLDGGRVLQSGIWAATGDRDRATILAANIGKVFAYLMIIGGFTMILFGNFIGGLWISFIGWFLLSGAEAAKETIEEKVEHA